MSNNFIELTDDQLNALHTWAMNHRKAWKMQLMEVWNGARRVPNYSPYLQQIRNTLGPAWLTKVNFPELDTEKHRRSLLKK